MLAIFLFTILAIWLSLIILFWIGWEKAQPSLNQAEAGVRKVSIVIAMRNEEENIINLLTDLLNQKYDKKSFEVILVNDHSTDSTKNLVESFIKNHLLTLKILELAEEEGKKAAIRLGVSRANYEIVLTTDGDCRLPPTWVGTVTACFANDQIKLVSGPVKMVDNSSFFGRMQATEFSSLIASGAATLSLGWPTMANAANMAFRKEVYYEMESQEGRRTSSGDDIFLLHEINRRYTNSTLFCKDRNAIVNTSSATDLNSFYQQRKRWAGKWHFYKDIPTVLLAIFVFLLNIMFVSLPILALLGILDWIDVANMVIVKILFEYWFLREVQKFFNSKILLYEFTILAIIYPLYVTFVALTGLIGGYRWKERMTK